MGSARFKMRPGLVLLVGAGILWGTIGISGRMIFDRSDLDPFEVSWLRTAFAMPFCLLIGYRMAGPRLFRVPRRDLLLITVLAVTLFGYQALYLIGVREVGISVATLLCLCSIPVLVTVYMVMVKGERLTTPVAMALVGAIGGTALLTLSEGGSQGNGAVLLGISAALASAVGASFYNIASRAFVQRYPPTTALALGFPITLVVFAPLVRGGHVTMDLPISVWLLLIYMGIGTQGIAYVLFQWGLQTESPTVASIVSLMEPVIASMLAWVIFGERLGPLGLAGAALLICGLVLLTVGPHGTAPDLAEEQTR